MKAYKIAMSRQIHKPPLLAFSIALLESEINDKLVDHNIILTKENERKVVFVLALFLRCLPHESRKHKSRQEEEKEKHA